MITIVVKRNCLSVSEGGEEGTPQGGPLSPLLANLLLDEVDRELERRGHCFVRYADDCNIYVKSERAGQRVMAQVTGLFERLKLKVNTAKSAVAPVEERQFLGYRLQRGTPDPGTGKRTATELVMAPRSQQRLREEVRRRTRRTVGKKLRDVIADLSAYLRGWAGGRTRVVLATHSGLGWTAASRAAPEAMG